MEYFRDLVVGTFLTVGVYLIGREILDYFFDISGKRRQQQFENERLTCRRCKGLASPIGGTGNRYRCDNCGNQFAGAQHSF
jgi:hypothetical protein